MYNADGGIHAAFMRDLDSYWESQEHVVRVTSILTQSAWDYLFPYANSIYTRDNFLRAVGHYPHFCRQKDYGSEEEALEMCKKELSTLLTHIIVDTNKNDDNSNIPIYRQGLFTTE